MLRDTKYAREEARATVSFTDSSQGRLEKLFIKKVKGNRVRFSWWKNDHLMRRPLVIDECELLDLLKDALQKDVFSPDFSAKLKLLLEAN